jgi:hypothetical protein
MIRGLNFYQVKTPVPTRGTCYDSFLCSMISWAKIAPDEIFIPKPDDPGETDIYTHIKPYLGPWTSPAYRKAAMLEVMRVLGGLESSWNWSEGVDVTNQTSLHNKTGEETGAWQVSYDSRQFGFDLRTISPDQPQDFIDRMKTDRTLAMSYISRLLRHTIRHHGPILRGEVARYVRRPSALEFELLLEA